MGLGRYTGPGSDRVSYPACAVPAVGAPRATVTSPPTICISRQEATGPTWHIAPWVRLWATTASRQRWIVPPSGSAITLSCSLRSGNASIAASPSAQPHPATPSIPESRAIPPDPSRGTAYRVYAPRDTDRDTGVRVAGTRGCIESRFEAAKGEVGLDEYEVRRATGGYRHMTLTLWALVLSPKAHAQPADLLADPGSGTHLSLATIRCLRWRGLLRVAHGLAHGLAWVARGCYCHRWERAIFQTVTAVVFRPKLVADVVCLVPSGYQHLGTYST